MAVLLWFSIIIAINCFSIILTQSQTNNCWMSRTQAQTRDKDVFIPECSADGLFASVQCHRSSGYCWCVDVKSGRPRSQTTTRNRSPNCNNNSGRRSTARENSSSGGDRNGGQRKEKRFCNSSQRVLFNTQLLSVFVSETIRKQTSNQTNESSIQASIESKFHELDLNLDDRITRQETRDLIQLIKKLFPLFRVCAQQMFQFCDQNNDSFVTKQEFKECLNFDYSFRAFLALNSTQINANSGSVSTGGAATDGSEEYQSQPKRTGFQNPFELNAHSNSAHNANESRLDCYITRANALESAKANPYGELFIPECTKDGYYVRIQCHKSYCWCVSRVSGQPIKTLQNMSPNTNQNLNQNQLFCDSMRKGCDQRRRNKFHQKLRQLLANENNTCATIFGTIDTNHNLVIEGQEWKHWRQLWRKSQTINSRLRKCFRTEMSYCDQNFDKKLSKQEWVQCCQPQESLGHSIASSPDLLSSSGTDWSGISDGGGGGGATSDTGGVVQQRRRSHKRLGPNPFSTILISE